MSDNFSIKTFVKRNARTSDKQKECYQRLYPQFCLEPQNRILNFAEIFGNTNKTIVEIGFGSGHATYKIASDNPETNYLAIDVFTTGVAKLLSNIDAGRITNIRIIEHDAVSILLHNIADNSVAGFHIFFPDPWPKKRHHKRRLLQLDKINLMAQKLINGGYLYFVTDWENYAESALEQLQLCPALKTDNPSFAAKTTWRPETSFEKKARAAGRNIYELMFWKQEKVVFTE